MDTEEIKINCIVNDSIDCYQYRIKIYNSQKKLIVDTFTIDGTFLFKVPSCDIYYFFIVPSRHLYPRYIWRKVYLKSFKQKELIFAFSKNIISQANVHPITFYATDSYYQGLKIGKGEIKLWLDHM